MRLFLATFLSLCFLSAKDIDLVKVFKSYNQTGTIIISSLNTKEEIIYNKKRSLQRFSPASTFKIANTLISLEEKVVRNEKDILKWDGKDKGWSLWNKDHSIKSAFPVSCVWCYQELAKRVGLKNYKKHIKNINYGNKKIGNDLTHFWLDGKLQISAKEQIEFLKQIYLEKIAFSKRNINILKDVMLSDKTDKYTIYSKTGWASKSAIGWYVGYMETKDDIWFFAMNMDMPKIAQAKFRKLITIDSLKIITPKSF